MFVQTRHSTTFLFYLWVFYWYWIYDILLIVSFNSICAVFNALFWYRMLHLMFQHVRPVKETLWTMSLSKYLSGLHQKFQIVYAYYEELQMKRIILETDILELKPCCCLCRMISVAWICPCIKYFPKQLSLIFSLYPTYASLWRFFLDIKTVFFPLIQERQIVLLLNETTATSDSSGNALLMMVQTTDLPFISISRSTSMNFWNLDQLQVGLSLSYCHQKPSAWYSSLC